ncbi:retinol dehydrogenase 12-like [Oppia nitens]|uniref:retinol dehydrogenase 12-like n=1 Tax=Oppia nitens TaxID=1686743 RepID=UPI0023DAD66F|nr:retinol dehydrogenase 12-like [Oppia nitens]
MYLIEIILPILWMTTIEFLQRIFGFRNNCKSLRQLNGQIVVITGANSGIGKETARELANRGAKIIIGCRDMSRAESAINDIKERNPMADIIAMKLDLSSVDSIHQFAKQLKKNYDTIDILINNAGVAMQEHRQTEDGFELVFGTNHLGHFLLTLLILPLLRRAPKARVITVASCAYIHGSIKFDDINSLEEPYDMWSVYGQSKLANILFTRELARRLGTDSSINTYAVHPGCVHTDIGRNVSSRFQQLVIKLLGTLFLLSAESGAQTTLYCAIHEKLDRETGGYYENCRRVKKLSPKATDDQSARRLWQLSAQLVQIEKQFDSLFG